LRYEYIVSKHINFGKDKYLHIPPLDCWTWCVLYCYVGWTITTSLKWTKWWCINFSHATSVVNLSCDYACIPHFVAPISLWTLVFNLSLKFYGSLEYSVSFFCMHCSVVATFRTVLSSLNFAWWASCSLLNKRLKSVIEMLKAFVLRRQMICA